MFLHSSMKYGKALEGCGRGFVEFVFQPPLRFSSPQTRLAQLQWYCLFKKITKQKPQTILLLLACGFRAFRPETELGLASAVA